jgi:DNA-directed RNA polymerase specialized sigma24 family protein
VRKEADIVTAEAGFCAFPKAIFVTALLLTGRVQLAEAAIERGFESLDDQDAFSDEELLRSTIIASNECLDSASYREDEETTRHSSFLPPELQAVLQLPHRLRKCFVLRFLTVMLREDCAGLLGLDAAAVDRNTGLAAQALAAICLTNQRREAAGERHDFSLIHSFSSRN